MRSTWRGALWLLAAIALGGVGAWGTPFMLSMVPRRAEEALADWVGGVPQSLLCDPSHETQGQAVLERIVARLYPLDATDSAAPVRVRVVRGDTVNAFATLGSSIYIFQGLLAEAACAEELAGVLAHEMEHVRRRHVLQKTFVTALGRALLQGIGGTDGGLEMAATGLFVDLQFSRSQEAQADEGAVRRLRQARIDPRALGRFFERLEEREAVVLSWASTHPATADRVALLEGGTALTTEPLVTDDEWQLVHTLCR